MRGLSIAPTGDIIWEYVRGAANEEIVMQALETGEGELVLCLAINQDGGLAKLDADGNVVWSRRFELAGWQFGSQIAAAEDGFLLAGFAMAPSRQADIWLGRCSSDGRLDWHSSFGDPASDDYATALLALPDGTYVIGALGSGMPLIHIDETGNTLWRRSLAGSRVHMVSDVIQLSDGGFLAAGLVEIQGGRSYDAVLVRTDVEGRVGIP